MRARYLIKKLICATLASVILTSPLSCLSASAKESDFSPDFSDIRSDYSVTVAPSELLSLLFPQEVISEPEKKYADEYFESALIYNDNVPNSNISVSLSNDRVTVTVAPHTYIGANGKTVTWLPSVCHYGDTSVQLSEADGYVCSFVLQESELITVDYTCAITLSSEYALSLARFAYGEQREAQRIVNENREALAKYTAEAQAYRDYLDSMTDYANKLDAYEEYLEKKAIYDGLLEEYNRYLAALKKYESDLAAYNKYVKEYGVYLEKKAAYEKAYAENKEQIDEYRAYLANLQAVRASTYAIESMFVDPTNGVRPLFYALQNAELVEMIEKYQDELVTYYGVSRDNIVSMRETSDALNELLNGYNEARQISEEEAFAFYKENYTEISDKFTYLYDKMTAIMTPTIYTHMCAWVEIEYKKDPEFATYRKWRIRNILCHIYLICRCLDDDVTADSTWSFYRENGNVYTYNFTDLLSQNVIISDTNSASPEGIEWWSGEVPDGSFPELPVEPTEVKKPAAVASVAKPVAPTAVSKPTEPTEVAAPSTRPQIENYELVSRVSDAGFDSELYERAAPDSTVLTFTKEVSRPFSDTALSAYFSYDNSLLSLTDAPTSVTRPSTAKYDYTFKEWSTVTADGDTFYYPIFTSTVREYTVTFKYADGDTALYECASLYGEIPEFVGQSPVKASTDTTVYTFAGWYPTVKPTTADTVYTAQFTETERKYTVTWDRGIFGKLERLCSFGESPTFPEVRTVQYDGGTRYTFTGWDKVAAPVSSDETYTAVFDITRLAYLPEGSSNTLTLHETDTAYVLTTDSNTVILGELLSQGSEVVVNAKGLSLKINAAAAASLSANGAHSLSILTSEAGVGYAFNKQNGGKASFEGDIRITLTHGLPSSDNAFILATKENGSREEISGTVGDKYVEFSAFPSVLYAPDSYRALSIECTEGGAAFADRTLYRTGERVTIRILPSPEYSVKSVTLTTASGEVTTVENIHDIRMPADNATLKVEFEVKKYAIQFVYDGEVLATQYYALGEVITPPDIAMTFEKEGFLYTFIGWSEPISIATGDATFTAKYYAVLMGQIVDTDDKSAVETVVYNQLLPAVLIILSVAGAITATIIVTRKKRKAKKAAEVDESADTDVQEQGEDTQ